MRYFFIIKWILILFFIRSTSTQYCDQPLETARFDCHPEPNSTEEKCLSRRCCWKPVFSKLNSTLIDPQTGSLKLDVPTCYYPRDFPTYQIVTNESTAFGQRLTIVKRQSTYLPNEILNLTVDLHYETTNRFRLRIYDSTKKRFEVPLPVPLVDTKVNITDYEVSLVQTPFAILIKRKSTGMTLFVSLTNSFMNKCIIRF